MANKREFKKYVDAIGASVIDEMIAAYYNVEKADKDKIAEAMQKVLCAIGRAKNNSNVTFDRGEKAFGDKKKSSRNLTKRPAPHSRSLTPQFPKR